MSDWHRAHRLLQAVDAQLGALITIARELREVTALLIDATAREDTPRHDGDRAPARARTAPVDAGAEPPATVEVNGAVCISGEELSRRLAQLGRPLKPATLMNYGTRGLLPIQLVGHRRYYPWPKVLEALHLNDTQTSDPQPSPGNS